MHSVIVFDLGFRVLFNGTADETKQWLEMNAADDAELLVADSRECRFKTVARFLDSGS